MKDFSVKERILNEIMDIMNEKDAETLGKHPKFMAAKIEVEPKDPKGSDDEMGLEKGLKKEMKAESLLGLGKEELGESESEDEDGISPEILAKLKELAEEEEM